MALERHPGYRAIAGPTYDWPGKPAGPWFWKVYTEPDGSGMAESTTGLCSTKEQAYERAGLLSLLDGPT